MILCTNVLEAQYTFVGDAADIGNNCYRITAPQEFQNGAIWYDNIIDLNDPFHLQYEAGFGTNPNGADGMVFVMQQVANDVLGLAGGGMGFEGFSPSFGVEFDTWQNFDYDDPAFDHMAFLINGNVIHSNPGNIAGPVQISATSPNVSDGEDHVVDIFWEPATNTVTVWFDCEERLTATIDLANDVFLGDTEVFWGFTGATGGSVNEHTVCLDPSILGLPETYNICTGESVELQVTGNAAGTYSWEPAAPLSNPTINNPIADPDETTEFTVTFTDLCGTENIQSTTVVVNEPEVDLGADLEACIGESIVIVPENLTGDPEWSDGSTEPTLEVTESGTYSLTSTIEGCTETDEVEVVFTEDPELNMPESASFCTGESFTVDLSGGGLDVTWADDPDAGAIREFTEAGTYTAAGSVGSCEAEASIDITVNELPAFDLGPDLEGCMGETVVLSAAPDAETTWNTGATQTSISVEVSGIYEAVSVLNGCEFSDQVEVIFQSAPSPQIAGETEFCESEGTVLTASGGDSYSWSNGMSGAEITTSSGGRITVTAIDPETGCPGTASVTLVVNPLPDIILPESIEKCIEVPVTLRPEVRGSDTVVWSTGDSTRTLEVSEPGAYIVIASNDCGETRAEVAVIEDECFQTLFIPNAFTPNGDGINDLFRVYGERIVRFNMKIYDRSGTAVFESNNIHATWNGSYQNSGYYCQAGQYSVHIELEYEDKSLLVRTGHVTLLR